MYILTPGKEAWSRAYMLLWLFDQATDNHLQVLADTIIDLQVAGDEKSDAYRTAVRRLYIEVEQQTRILKNVCSLLNQLRIELGMTLPVYQGLESLETVDADCLLSKIIPLAETAIETPDDELSQPQRVMKHLRLHPEDRSLNGNQLAILLGVRRQAVYRALKRIREGGEPDDTND